jgi:adenine/guanine phosphoribosyltransferase-like PRPP-binding protein
MDRAIRLLKRCGASIEGIVVAMRQGTRWREKLVDEEGKLVPMVWVFDSPRMIRQEDRWIPEAGLE